MFARRIMSSTTKIELWTNDCYGCDRYGKYDAIRRYVIESGIPLQNFAVKRVILNPDWQQEAESLGVEVPFVKFINEKGEKMTIPYSNFEKGDYIDWKRDEDGKIEVIDESEDIKVVKVRKKKTTSIKKKEVKTTSEE